MNPSNMAPESNAPQRRKRGINSNTAEKISPIASATVKGCDNAAGTFILVMMVAHVSGSRLFQMPAPRKKTPNPIAAAQLAIFCQGAISAAASRFAAYAILSAMIPILVPLALFLAALAYGQVADLVVENAVIYTVDAKKPKAVALAVKDGRFIYVGEKVTAHVGPHTQRIDAKGGTIIPGLIDSHTHLRGLGDLLTSNDFRRFKSPSEIGRASCRERV